MVVDCTGAQDLITTLLDRVEVLGKTYLKGQVAQAALTELRSYDFPDRDLDYTKYYRVKSDADPRYVIKTKPPYLTMLL